MDSWIPEGCPFRVSGPDGGYGWNSRPHSYWKRHDDDSDDDDGGRPGARLRGVTNERDIHILDCGMIGRQHRFPGKDVQSLSKGMWADISQNLDRKPFSQGLPVLFIALGALRWPMLHRKGGGTNQSLRALWRSLGLWVFGFPGGR